MSGPRIILEDSTGPAERLDFDWDRQTAVPPRASARWSTLSLLLAGAAVLVLGLSALDAANFVAAQFARAAWLGWLTLVIAVTGYGLIAWALSRETRALFALHAVDATRAAFARNDLPAAKRDALRWAADNTAAQAILPALRAADDIPTLRALLESGPLARLGEDAAVLGRAAAMQAFAATAISPSAGLDAVIFGWRGLRLIRQIATLHGFRPGLAATIALLRRTLTDAATIAGTDLAMDLATRAIVSHPLLAHLGGETAAGAVAARRMLLLARAADEACRIVPR